MAARRRRTRALEAWLTPPKKKTKTTVEEAL